MPGLIVIDGGIATLSGGVFSDVAGTDCCCAGPELQACCLSTGQCIDTTVDNCQLQGGTPQGPGTTCASTVCEACPSNECVGCPNQLRFQVSGLSVQRPGCNVLNVNATTNFAVRSLCSWDGAFIPGFNDGCDSNMILGFTLRCGNAFPPPFPNPGINWAVAASLTQFSINPAHFMWIINASSCPPLNVPLTFFFFQSVDWILLNPGTLQILP